MQRSEQERRTFDELVSRWCAGDITVEEANQLSELLSGDETLVAEFAESIQLNAISVRGSIHGTPKSTGC